MAGLQIFYDRSLDSRSIKAAVQKVSSFKLRTLTATALFHGSTYVKKLMTYGHWTTGSHYSRPGSIKIQTKQLTDRSILLDQKKVKPHKKSKRLSPTVSVPNIGRSRAKQLLPSISPDLAICSSVTEIHFSHLLQHIIAKCERCFRTETSCN